MSRASVENERFQFVFGVDHVLGTFIQIYDKENNQQEEGPIIEMNARYGVRVSEFLDTQLRETNPSLLRVVKRMKDAYETEKLLPNPRTNLGEDHVIQLAAPVVLPILYWQGALSLI